ncbi:hypothetical protein AL037_16730 [Salipiger aestuarii]|nr:hypothetical protein AL037_16730 [Salipiger aestuarii]
MGRVGQWDRNALLRLMVADPGGRLPVFRQIAPYAGRSTKTGYTGESCRRLARDGPGTPQGISIPARTRDLGRHPVHRKMARTLRTTANAAHRWPIRRRPDRGRTPGQRPGRGAQAVGHGPWGWLAQAVRGCGGQPLSLQQRRGHRVAITSGPTRPAPPQGYLGTRAAVLDGPILAMT